MQADFFGLIGEPPSGGRVLCATRTEPAKLSRPLGNAPFRKKRLGALPPRAVNKNNGFHGRKTAFSRRYAVAEPSVFQPRTFRDFSLTLLPPSLADGQRFSAKLNLKP